MSFLVLEDDFDRGIQFWWLYFVRFDDGVFDHFCVDTPRVCSFAFVSWSMALLSACIVTGVSVCVVVDRNCLRVRVSSSLRCGAPRRTP